MNSIQNYVKDQTLILMVEDGKLIAKERSKFSGLQGVWIWLQATVMGRGPASFKTVCEYIHAHPELFKTGDEESVVAWLQFKKKVENYNSQRFFSWKKASIPLVALEFKTTPVDNRDRKAVIDNVQKLSKILPQLGMKLALIIGRTTDEPIPVEKDTVWVSLDTNLGENLDPSRIHLMMDYNARIADRLTHLFDKIVMDPCTLTGDDPWRRLHGFLRPGPESVLISFASGPYVSVTINQKEAEEQSNAHRGMVTQFFKNGQSDDPERYRGIAHAKAKAYLQTLFNKVLYVQNEDYPYYKTPLKSTYFHMQGTSK